MIDQKAREIAGTMINKAIDEKLADYSIALEAARLGIIEGLEMAAVEINALKDALAEAESRIALLEHAAQYPED